MPQSFLMIKGRNVAVIPRMRQGFVDVEELDAFGVIVSVDRLQTGGVSKKRGSGQATKDEDGIVLLECLC